MGQDKQALKKARWLDRNDDFNEYNSFELSLQNVEDMEDVGQWVVIYFRYFPISS